jgi:predicted secreted protein
MRRFLLVALLALTALSSSRAGDSANMSFIGFSRDGAYLAFEQFGISDGSGFPYSGINVVSVARNAFVASAEMSVQDENKPVKAVRDAARAKAKAALAKYGIVAGNQGRFHGLAGFVQMAASNYQIAYFEALGRTYQLESTSQVLPNSGELCVEAPQLLRVTLDSRVLQRDTRLPESRQCAYDYEFHSAFVYGRSLAVFMRYKTRGFEGADVRWMVVTTRL